MIDTSSSASDCTGCGAALGTFFNPPGWKNGCRLFVGCVAGTFFGALRIVTVGSGAGGGA